MDTDNRELYRIISGFPKYCISNRGRVMNILSGKYLSTSRNKHGYLLVDLYNGTSHKIFYLHRLVVSYFIQSRVCAGERKSYKSFIWKYKV